MATTWLKPGTSVADGSSFANATGLVWYKNNIHTHLTPGDQVFCLPNPDDSIGAYDTDAAHDMVDKACLTFRNNGSSGAHIVFKAVHQDGSLYLGGADFRGPAMGPTNPLYGLPNAQLWNGFDIRGQYIDIVGIRVSQSPFKGFTIAGQNILVDRCYGWYNAQCVNDANTGGQNFLLGGTALNVTLTGCDGLGAQEHNFYYSGGATNCSFINNVCRYGGRLIPPGTMADWLAGNNLVGAYSKGGVGAAGMQVNIGSGGVITGNRIYGSSRWGLLMLAAVGFLVDGNFIWDSGHRGISIATSTTRSFTDLVIGSDPKTATSAAKKFVQGDVGSILQVTGGPGFTPQFAQVVSVSGVVATFDVSLGTANSTGGIGVLGSGSHDNTISNNQVASATRECLNIDDSNPFSFRNAVISNKLFAKNFPYPNIPISYGFPAQSIGIPNIAYAGAGTIASGGNVFRKGGGSYTVAKTNPSQSDVTFAAYQAAFGDNTSVESTATGLSLGLDNDILIWLGEPPPPSDLYSHVLASASGGPGLLNEGVPVGGRA